MTRDPYSFIQTFTGRAFWPLDPRAEDVDLVDIAHALSLKCRYQGHCRSFYSVAEHSIHVSKIVAPQFARVALLHDAAEAYIPDVPRPIKHLLGGFKDVEVRIEKAIAEHFGLPFPWPEEVKVADATILADEKNALMGREPMPWHLPYPPAGVHIACWEPEVAKWAFCTRYWEVSR